MVDYWQGTRNRLASSPGAFASVRGLGEHPGPPSLAIAWCPKVETVESDLPRGSRPKGPAMALTAEATFEDGVFGPVQRPALKEHERVRLTIEPMGVNSSGLEDIRRRRGRRIRLDAELALEIASSPEFDLDGS